MQYHGTERSWLSFLTSGALGGILMGLANLVPGVSGGTMLLAMGIYPDFISAIADVTALRLKPRPMLLLGVVGGCAVLAILLLAGAVKGLVIDHRWVMYSIFIGLTLGGVPLVLRLARPLTLSVFAGASVAFVLMVLMALGSRGSDAGSGSNVVLLTLSGLAGASAMILPGVSGGYILLLLGQYETILGAIDKVKIGLLGNSATGSPPDFSQAVEALNVVIPVVIGVVIGVVGVSNLLKWLLARYNKVTMGVLLGLLLGAVVGIWPFQQVVRPGVGDTVGGTTLTAADIKQLDPEQWPVVFFDPTVSQVTIALLLIGGGLAVTWLIALVGGGKAKNAGAA
jgi:putative membrane protein